MSEETRALETTNPTEPRSLEEMFQLLEKLSQFSQEKYVTRSYPAVNTQSQDKS